VAVAVATRLDTNNLDAETALALDPALDLLELPTLKFLDAPALDPRQMDVLARQEGFVKLFFTFQVHQVEFVHQPQPPEHAECPLNGDLVERGVLGPGSLPKRDGVKVALSGPNNFDQERMLARPSCGRRAIRALAQAASESNAIQWATPPPSA
jgi:hypothetical protein